MFSLALLFLAGTAAAIALIRQHRDAVWQQTEMQLLVGCLSLLWVMFLIEAVARYFVADKNRRTWNSLGWCLATGVVPPLRLGAHSRTRPGHLWLPWYGWQEIDFDLQKDLERIFAGPMFLMALLILPVLAVEYFWSDEVTSFALLRAILAISVGLIWIAFTVEFVIRISVADKKIRYAFNHWIDLAVVLLPMLEFLPFLRILRITRLMRLEKMARIAKYYRLYGVAGKGWQGFVALRLIQQVVSRSPQARITRLRSELEEKQEEIREIEREADYYRRRIRSAEQELEAHQPSAHTS